jgi:transcriptional regulator
MNIPELKKGSAEFLILSLIEHRARHGYELCRLIETRSQGTIAFNVASLYPVLYRMEERGLVEGRWVEKPRQRRRRFYRITRKGKESLASARESWKDFVRAIGRIVEPSYS